ncbi:hypothetical protein ACFVZW_08435 [Streptomyces sp. NPDC059567]|uniref:hypothetical protein n=1 Tax=Streptomyces sp. NPDC059567 TaxID=3346867 RepID=UPI00367F7A38
MGTYNFHGPISGQSNFGDHGRNQIFHHGATPADALRLAGELVALLRAESPGREEAAELLRAELVRADEEDRPVDEDRIRGWLATLRDGSAAGSGAIALITSLTQALGM